MAPLELSFRFPFGRYGATPWYSSRREELRNVEWPPSPWRLGRALVAVAAEHGRGEDWSRSLSLACRLAASAPSYSLPRAGELHYTQWMPQLEFGDSLTSAERLDNGHALLDLDPSEWLTARWEADLDADDLDLLDTLLGRLPYLGQSVSVCEARRGPAPGEPGQRGWARPAATIDEAPANTHTLQLLVAEPGIEGDQLRADTADPTLKLQPAPPGTRWVPYLVSARLHAVHGTDPQRLSALVYRLDGVLRPPVARLDDVSAGDAASTLRAALAIALDEATDSHHAVADAAAITLLDDDLDGRAERLRIDLAQPLEHWRAKSLLEPPDPLVVGSAQLARAAHRRRTEPPRVSIDCTLHLDAVEWAAPSGSPPPPAEVLVADPICFELSSGRLPSLADAITVAEVFRRRLLGVAAAQWGPHAIPDRLSGRDRSGSRLLTDHHHAHFLVGSTNDREITHLMTWAPGGFTREEQDAIAAVRLPALAGAGIRLRVTEYHPCLKSARRWRTTLPFLPVRHSKRRGGRMVDTIEDQVALELRRREFDHPVSITLIERDWRLVRTTRRGRAGSSPGLGAHGVEIEFDHPVDGPVALGANSHFSMGLFAPLDPS